MTTAYSVPYVVPPGIDSLEYPARSGNCYKPGDTVWVKQTDIACFLTDMQEQEKAKCFPAYCVDDKGYPTEGYRVLVEVPPEETLPVSVPFLEGCKPPAMVCFHQCGACIYVGYDAEPIMDPEDPAVANGGAPDPNPTCRKIANDDGCVETIFIHNASSVPNLVTLSFYC